MDAAAYRDQGELQRALEGDPLKLAGMQLAALGVAAERISAADTEAQAEIEAALAAAHAAPPPEPTEAYADVQDTGAGQWR